MTYEGNILNTCVKRTRDDPADAVVLLIQVSGIKVIENVSIHF